MGIHAPPLTFRKPYFLFCHAVSSALCRNRSHKNIIAKEIFSVIGICLILLRILIVERATNRQTCIVSLSCHRIDVREKRIAQADSFKDSRKVRELPYSSFYSTIGSGVSTENRGKYSKLYPTQDQIWIVY